MSLTGETCFIGEMQWLYYRYPFPNRTSPCCEIDIRVSRTDSIMHENSTDLVGNVPAAEENGDSLSA